MKWTSGISAKVTLAEKEININFDLPNDSIVASYNYLEPGKNENSTLQVFRNAKKELITNIYNVSDIASIMIIETAIREWLGKGAETIFLNIRSLES